MTDAELQSEVQRLRREVLHLNALRKEHDEAIERKCSLALQSPARGQEWYCAALRDIRAMVLEVRKPVQGEGR